LKTNNKYCIRLAVKKKHIALQIERNIHLEFFFL